MKRYVPVLVAVLGFVLLVINAVDYLGGFNQLSGGNTIIGLMLVIMGMYMSKKGK
jgi:hypothetical protein